jgi:hypothetical protein
MTVVWFVLAALWLLVWVLSVVDIFRRHYPAGTTIGWIALVVLLPFLGTLIYWGFRKPSQHEIEQSYHAEADMRQHLPH